MAADLGDIDKAIMDALVCGTGVLKIVHHPGSNIEMVHVPIDKFYDLSEELLWRAANTVEKKQ